MIHDCDHQMFSSGEIVAPFLQGLGDSEEFPIIDIVILFCRGKGGRMIGTGMEIPVGVFCMSIPPVAVREASVMTKNGLVVSGILITGAERNVSLSLINVSSCSFPHKKIIPFLVRLWSGQVSTEKLGMNFR